MGYKFGKTKDDTKVPVRNMLMGRAVSVFLSKTKVNGIHLQKRLTWDGYIRETTERDKKGNWKGKHLANTWFARLPKPMRKLSGLMSLCKNDLEWINSTRFICNYFKIANFKKISQWKIRKSINAIQEILPSDQQAWEQFWGTISDYRNWINPRD